MLDELLGRAELKARIEELEEEKRHLQRRAEAEEERRSEAVRDRQDAEERVNRLEDRIADLEGRLERVGDEEDDLSYRGTADLRGRRLAEVLSRLRSVETEPEGALTAMVGEGDPPDAVAEATGDEAALVRRAAPCLVCADDAGLVCVALSPPLPPDPFVEWGEGFRVEESWFRPTGRLTVALVRSDVFALGEYESGERRDVETIESNVKSAHSKGGFSQARFQRRRDEQIDAHVERAREAIARRDPDRLVVLGERTVLGEFADLADHTATVDATGDPETALESAVSEFWTTRLYRL